MHRGFSSLIISGLIFISISLFHQSSYAGKVVKVKGKKVYIKLSKTEAGSVEKGDKLYLTTKSGKKKGIVKIRKVKGRKALAKLTKGKANKGYRTRLKKSKPKPDTNDYAATTEMADSSASDTMSSRPDMLFGLMGSFGLASQSVQQTNGTSDQTGSSIGVKGLLDYSLFDDIGVRGQFGLEMFSVSGDGVIVSDGPDNGSLGTIGTDITYLSIDLLLRWYLVKMSSLSLYLNGGIGIYSPLSTETKALDEASISTTSILILGAGVAFPIGTMELFLGADYFYFPPSEEVTTSVISMKAGILFDF